MLASRNSLFFCRAAVCSATPFDSCHSGGVLEMLMLRCMDRSIPCHNTRMNQMVDHVKKLEPSLGLANYNNHSYVTLHL
jgi:hypothetical protein